jgi:hypothetical protein
LGVYEYDATVYVPFATASLLCAICADSKNTVFIVCPVVHLVGFTEPLTSKRA